MKLTQEQKEQFAVDKEITGFKIIQDKLVNDFIDDGDSNEHEVVIQDEKTEKLYMFEYNEWVGAGLDADEFDGDLKKVFKKNKNDNRL